MIPLSFMLVLALAAVHLFVERLRLRAIPRSAWLSAASGSSVAYVFVHIFPQLAEYERVFATDSPLEFLGHHVYLVGLLGFCTYYGVERAVQRYGRPAQAGETDAGDRLFWVHIGAFALYYALIGYLLLHRDEPGPVGLVTYALAMGLHFMVIDVSLSVHHRGPYHRGGRWVLALAVIVGWLVGLGGPLDSRIIGAAFAFLAGGIVLNVIKEELPADRRSSAWAFACGTLAFAILLLMTVEA